MSSNLAVRVLPETLRTIAFGSIGSGYTAIGTAFIYPVHFFILVNTTNQLLYFSVDGVNNHFVLPAGAQMIVDVSSNSALNGGAFMLAAGTTLYVEYPGSAPTSGNVYLSVFYGYTGH